MPTDETVQRVSAPADRAIAFGPFRVLPERHLLLKNDKPVPVGARALEMLIALLEQPGELVTKDQLVAQAWPNMIVEESNLRAPVGRRSAPMTRVARNGRECEDWLNRRSWGASFS